MNLIQNADLWFFLLLFTDSFRVSNNWKVGTHVYSFSFYISFCNNAIHFDGNIKERIGNRGRKKKNKNTAKQLEICITCHIS